MIEVKNDKGSTVTFAIPPCEKRDPGWIQCKFYQSLTRKPDISLDNSHPAEMMQAALRVRDRSDAT